MYPNQQSGYNQYNPPFGANPSMPMPQYPNQMPQPFGAGYSQMPGMPMPQQNNPSPYGGFQGQMNYQNQMPSMNQQMPYQPHQQNFDSYNQQQNSYQQPYAPPSVYPNLPTSATSPIYQHQQSNASSYGTPNQHQYQSPQFQISQSTPMYGSQQTGQIKKGRPTVTPASNFNASNDCAILRKAMKGFGTDEDAIISVLCHRTVDQRMEIVRTYKTAYGKDLLNDIRSETSGNFEKILIALLTPTTELYCRELYEAMAGAGTDEDVLIEVMCTMSNYEIRQICAQYVRMYGQPLEHQLRSDTSGHMKRLMTSLSVGGRDESMHTDVNQARADAETLRAAGVGRWGTDESEFNRILCLRNYEQIKLICQEYEKITGSSLEKDIKKEFSGDIEDALLAIIRVAKNRPEFFARRLHKSMAGLGTDDKSLIRLVVTRSEIDMMDIKDEFQRYYGKTLKSFIKGDTSGHYKHALYALCGESRS
ncbi:hypothetical protein PVAND_012345 [Polypedilum vanderplanki]|uniref:Annexin n=1 Tax=Polypedilum vanderplanki TaxID=319348 RepID=A0A9J6CN49_POLVA|nr:hypothetical protein PVAND_012345 [Polypedilum vanderplanki]